MLCLPCLAQRPDVAFGEHLKSFRLAAGLKIVDLARQAGIRATVISGYEHGRIGTPSWTIMIRLFQALGVSLSLRLMPSAIPDVPEEERAGDRAPAHCMVSLLSVG